MVIIPSWCCRGGDAIRIIALTPNTIGVIAKQLGRSTRYVHSICQDDDRLIIAKNGKRVQDYHITINQELP
jgi:hypothetical protein